MQTSRKLSCSAAMAMFASSAFLPAQGMYGVRGLFQGGSITGTVVDVEGIPQMGALVQLLLPDATPAATVLTDNRGHYRIGDLRPGRYRVRVSASLFLPAVRQTLQIGSGTRAVVNMTLTTLLAPEQWLPATRRTGDAASDDWMWTLRSSTMRPVLRVAAEESGSEGAPVGISTSSRERSQVRSKGSIAFQANDGTFAHGGNHQILTLERTAADGSAAILRADLSGSRTPYPIAPSTEISAGWQQKLPLGASSRTVLTYVSHPELLNEKGGNGMQAAVLRNAQRMELGDVLRVDAGSVTQAFNLGGNAFEVDPFVRVAYRAGDGVVIAYAFTAARGTSQIEDLDRITPSVPVAVSRNGHLRLSRGHSNSIALAVRTPKAGKAELSAYRESVTDPMLSGVGTFAAADLANQPLLLDPTTQTFALASHNFNGTGVRFALDQPITDQFSLGAEIAGGTVLKVASGQPISLATVQASIGTGNAVSAAVHGRAHFAKSGTRLDAGYRWQRAGTLSAVDSFRTGADPAYLHCTVHQSLHRVPLLPNGLEVMVAVQNLLEEGYQPVLYNDGHTLYLAQTPRMVQAGLAFTF